MAKKISSNDLFDANLFTKTKYDAVLYLAVLKEIENEYKDILTIQGQIVKTAAKNDVSGLNQRKKAIETMTAAEKELLKVEKAIEVTEAKLTISEKQQVQVLAELRAELNAKNKAQRDSIKASKEESNSYKKLTADVNKAQAEFKKLAAQFGINSKQAKQAQIALDGVQKELMQIDAAARDGRRNVGRYGTAIESLKGGFSSLKNAIGGLGLAIGGGMLFKSSFNTLAEFDEKLADIAKTTGLTIEKARELSLSLGEIDTRTSISNLQELAVAAGRLGIDGTKNIEEFVVAADKVFVALGDDLTGTADEIATELGKIASVFGDEAKFGIGESINKTGSALNELSAKSKATAGDILDFTKRLAGVSSQAKISQTDIQALGAFFAESGQSMEVSSTVLNKLLPELAKNQEHFAEVAGMTAEEFEKIMQNNPIEALKAVAVGANSSEGGLIGLNETLESFGIESARAASIVGVLSSNTGRLTELQKISNDAFNEGTSLTNEFNLKNETTSALLEKLGKEWDKQILGIGGTTAASEGLKSVLSFLIRNLGTIISIATKGSIIWASYKTTMVALNVVEKASLAITKMREQGLKSLFIVQKATDEATTKSTKTFKIFNQVVKANPIALIIAGVTAAILIMNEFAQSLTGAEKGYLALNDARIESEKAIANEKAELDKLIMVAQDETISKEKRESAIKAINELSPEYLGNLTLETIGTDEATTSINAYVSALEKKAYQTAINNKLSDAYSRLIDAENSSLKDNSGVISWGLYLQGQSALATNYEILTRYENIKSIKDEIDVLKNAYVETVKGQTATEYATETTNENTTAINAENAANENKTKALTGLARLQKELSDIEKKRSDVFVDNSGIANDEFIELTKQSDELKLQIELLQNRLKLSTQFFDAEIIAENKLFEAKSRTAGNIDSESTAPTAPVGTGQTNDELLADYKKYLDDKAKIEDDAAKKEAELLSNRIDAAQEFANKLVEISNDRIDKQLESIDKEVDASKARQEQLEQIANQGQLTAQQSLKSEIRQQAELEKRKAELEQRKQRREVLASGFNLLTANLEKGATGNDAVTQTFRQMTNLISLLANLPGFYKGTDYAPEGLAWTDEKGAEIHLDKNGNIKDWGSDKGAQLKHLAKGDKILTANESSIVKRQLNMQPSLDAKELKSANSMNDARIVQAVQAVVQAVNDKPVQSFEYDEIQKAVIDQMKGKNSLMKKHISNKPKF